jgi:ubiquinone biosynthesis protein
MLRKDDLPTPLVDRSQTPLQTVEARAPGVFQIGASLVNVVTFLMTVLTIRFRVRDPQERAARIRSLVEFHGGIWVKVGQILATRRDILSAELCSELERLQDRVAGFPAVQSREVIEDELKEPIEDLFADFIAEPVAAASVSQIHRARLRDENTWVAVKVRRPHIEGLFRRDLALIRFVCRALEWAGVLHHMRWTEMYEHLQSMLLEETDLRIEAGSIAQMRQSLKDHINIYVPYVHMRYCTEKVLVMEWIDGVVFSDYLAVLADDPERIRAWLRENEVEPRRVAKNVFLSVHRQIYEDNLFHGDLHPGNLMFLRRNMVALIDFGAVSSVSTEFLSRLKYFHQLLLEGKLERAMAVMLSMSSPLPRVNVDELIRKLVQHHLNYAKVTGSRAFSAEEKSQHEFAGAQARILNEYRVPVCWDFLRITRTVAALEISLRSLDPTIDYSRLTALYLRRKQRRERARRGARFEEDLGDLFELVKLGHDWMYQEILARHGAQRLVRVEPPIGLAEIATRSIRLLRRAFLLAFVACALASLTSIAVNVPLSPVPVIERGIAGLRTLVFGQWFGWALVFLILYYLLGRVLRQLRG